MKWIHALSKLVTPNNNKPDPEARTKLDLLQSVKWNTVKVYYKTKKS